MTYFIISNGKPQWVATMPLGTDDLEFARKVAASLPAGQVITRSGRVVG